MLLLTTAVTLALAIVPGLRLVLLEDSGSLVGFPLFKICYLQASDKNSELRGYEANLKVAGGGSIPDRVDEFLCGRLQNPDSTDEFNAVVDFYVRKSYGRDGQYIFLLPTATKARITNSLMARLDAFSPHNAECALVLIESLREGRNMGKSTLIYDCEGPVNAFAGPESPADKIRLKEAEDLFRKWGQTYPSWAGKAAHNPLENSKFEITGI